MREPLCHVKVFLVVGDGVGICQHLVHTAVLGMQDTLHLVIRKSCRQIDGPVTETEEELFGFFVTAIDPSITKTGIHLMDIIKRYPRAIVSPEVALFKGRPDTVTSRHTAYITLAPLRMVLRVGFGTGLQFADEIVHPLLALCIACGSIDGHRRQIVTTNMTVKTIPVRIRLPFGGKTCLLEVRCQQSVAVILQQCLDIQVAGLLQRTVEQRHVTKWKFVSIEPVLRCSSAHGEQQRQ